MFKSFDSNLQFFFFLIEDFLHEVKIKWKVFNIYIILSHLSSFWGKKKKKKRSNLNRELSGVKIVRLQLHRVKRYHFTILWPTRLVRIGFVTRDGSY